MDNNYVIVIKSAKLTGFTMAERAASKQKQKRGFYYEYLQMGNPISSMPRRTRYRYQRAIKATHGGNNCIMTSCGLHK